jgi:hypothetical protein
VLFEQLSELENFPNSRRRQIAENRDLGDLRSAVTQTDFPVN